MRRYACRAKRYAQRGARKSHRFLFFPISRFPFLLWPFEQHNQFLKALRRCYRYAETAAKLFEAHSVEEDAVVIEGFGGNDDEVPAWFAFQSRCNIAPRQQTGHGNRFAEEFISDGKNAQRQAPDT